MKRSILKKSILLSYIVFSMFCATQNSQAFQLILPNSILDNIDMKFAPIYISTGDDYTSKKEFELAENSYRKAIEIDPENITIKFRLGLILEVQQKLRKAEEVYREIIKYRPENVKAFYSLGLVLDQLNETDEAIKQLKKALELDPQNAFINYDIGVVYAKLRDYPNSKVYSQNAVDIKPDFAEALNNLCYAQGNIREYEHAIKNCENSLKYKPDSAATIDSLGFVYQRMGNYDKAIELYLEAISKDNSIGEIFYHLAESYDCKQDYVNAIIYYKKSIEIEKDAYYEKDVTKRINHLEKMVDKDDLKKKESDLKDVTTKGNEPTEDDSMGLGAEVDPPEDYDSEEDLEEDVEVEIEIEDE